MVDDIQIWEKLLNIEREVLKNTTYLTTLQQEVVDLAATVEVASSAIAELLADSRRIIGINVKPGPPLVKSSPLLGEPAMAKATVSLLKKSRKQATAKPGAKASGTAFVFVDNENDTCTVMGTDAAGAPVDITAVATITVTSDTPAVCTVATPVGMTFQMTGVSPGNANITAVATWNDGSIGPFNFTLPVALITGGPTGITIVPGIPTVS